jgi:hypothetical protein
MRGILEFGCPNAALADTEDGLKNARELSQAATLMWALFYGVLSRVWCGKYAGARLQADELVLANEKGTPFWKANGIRAQGYLLAEAGGAVDAIRMIPSGLDAYRSTGSTLRVPTDLSYLASAYLKVGEYEDLGGPRRPSPPSTRHGSYKVISCRQRRSAASGDSARGQPRHSLTFELLEKFATDLYPAQRGRRGHGETSI